MSDEPNVYMAFYLPIYEIRYNDTYAEYIET